MNRVVLDASAIIAAIAGEPGSQKVLEQLPHAAVSTVNLSEVQSKLIERGFPPEDAWESALSFTNEVFDFDSRQAKLAGMLIQASRPYGLSFGDRACLALASVLGAPVYTTDRIWAKLDVNLKIHILR